MKSTEVVVDVNYSSNFPYYDSLSSRLSFLIYSGTVDDQPAKMILYFSYSCKTGEFSDYGFGIITVNDINYIQAFTAEEYINIDINQTFSFSSDSLTTVILNSHRYENKTFKVYSYNSNNLSPSTAVVINFDEKNSFFKLSYPTDDFNITYRIYSVRLFSCVSDTELLTDQELSLSTNFDTVLTLIYDTLQYS